MKNKAIKILSIVISFIMIFSTMSYTAFAENNVETTNDDTEEYGTGYIEPKLSSGDDFLYTEENDGIYISSYIGTDADVVVPTEINGKVVKQINTATFKGYQYTSISFPSNLYFCAHNAIYNCPNLKTISVYGDEGGYYVENGGLMYKGVHSNNNTRLCYVPDAYEGTFIIPEGTIDIGRDTFDNCVAIETLIVPKSLISTWDNYYVTEDFENCVSLNTVYGSTNVSKLISDELGCTYYQFDDEENFEYTENEKTHEITITGYIGNNSTVIVPNCIDGKKVTVIKQYVFGGPQFNQIIFYAGISNLEWDAIYNCPNLTNVNTYGDSGYTTQNGILVYNGPMTGNKTVIVYVPDGMTSDIVLPDDTYGVQADAFDNCRYVENIVFPENIEYYLNSQALGDPNALFVNMTSLKRVYGYEGTVAESLARANNAEFISLNSNVYFKTEQINDSSLAITDVITKTRDIVIPTTLNGKTMTTIKVNALSWKNFKSLYIPSTITNIENGAFRACSALSSITIEEGNPNYFKVGKAIYSTNMKNLVFVERNYNGEFVIPEGVEVIYTSCMHYCNGITNIVIPETVTTIGTFAFRHMSITSVTIPSSVTKISSFAFFEDSKLASVTLPTTPLLIERGAFEQCYNLTTITIPKKTTLGANVFKNNGLTEIHGYKGTDSEKYANELGITFIEILDFTYENKTIHSVSGIEIVSYTGDDSTIVIPDYIDNLPVISIRTSAIRDNDTVQKIVLPSNMYYYGYNAIRNCPNLKSIVLSEPTYDYYVENNMVIYVAPEGGDHADEGIVRLCYVADGLEGNLIIPKAVNEFGDECLDNCSKITSITIYETVTGSTFGSNQLFALNSLKTVYGYIGTYAEEAASELNNVTFVPLDVTKTDATNNISVTGKYSINAQINSIVEGPENIVFAVEGYNCVEKVNISLTENELPVAINGNLTITLKASDYTKLHKVYQFTNNEYVSLDCENSWNNIIIKTNNLDPIYVYEDSSISKIVVDKVVTAKNINQVDVRITFVNCPGITTAKLNVEYGSHLKLEKVTFNTDTLGGFSMTSKELTSPVTLNWFNGTKDIQGTFVYATLTFSLQNIDKDVITDDIIITYDKNNIANVDESLVKLSVVNGSVKINPYMPGDINDDSFVDNRDLIRLFKYLSEIDVIVNEYALDVNGDGSVNNKDLTRLFQYCSDWAVELH